MDPKKIPVTVLVQTKNEATGIAECLRQLWAFGEVIVVDSCSTDRTKDIAQSLGARVVDFEWNGRYPKKKQWQLENVDTAYPWVMFLDADEAPTPELLDELQNLFSRDRLEPVGAFDINLDYVFAGKMLRHGHRVTKRALVRKDRVKFPEMDDLEAPGMGELEGHYQPEVRGRIGRLRGRIRHNDLDPVSTWFDRHNRYSEWEAYLRTSSVARSRIRAARTLKGRVFDGVPCKPLAFFLYAYIVKLGFLDGRAGFDYAFALSAYYWQIGLKVRERVRRAEHLP